MLLQALRAQTFVNWDFTIVDDNDDPNILPNSHNFRFMLNLLELEGHTGRIIKGFSRGPQIAHNILLMSARHELLLRLDDDLLPNTDFVEKLYNRISQGGDQLAAVGGVFPGPRSGNIDNCYLSKPEDIERAENEPFQAIKQRYLHKNPAQQEVCILYSSFIYRRSAVLEVGGFPVDYSPIGESEEADTTYRLYKKGYTLIVDQTAVAWHFFHPSGGIRTEGQEERKKWFFHDIQVWQEKLGRLDEGDFDFPEESKKNLDAFRGFEAFRDCNSVRFLNYPNPPVV